MKTKLTFLMAAALLSFGTVKSQSSCPDMNGFVDYKNTGGTGTFHLAAGFEEYAAQTYHYSGPGKVSSVRVYGSYPGLIGGVALRVGIYNVDGSGRPSSVLQTANTIWWVFYNPQGYIDVPMPGGGVTVNNSFAVSVQLLNQFPYGTSFNVRYTGNGEGKGQDLASLAGTSTGGNWSSAMTNFSKDGDFYLVPGMTNYNIPSFSASSNCNQTGAAVSFVNSTSMSMDSMFNKIGIAGYTGTNRYFTWNFGDGSPVSNVASPVHTFTAPGVYNVSLTSKIEGWNSLCSKTFTSRVSVGLAVAVSSSGSVSCNGLNNGALTVAGTGGAPTYNYSIDGINYQSSPTFSNLSAGAGVVYVKDALGCTHSVGYSITQPLAIVFNTVSSTNASCGNSDGSILVVAGGGAGSIQYALNGGTYQAGGTFSSLAAGVYTVSAKDANGCVSTNMVTVNDVGGPSISSITGAQVSCNGGSNGQITINASGGSGSLQYSIYGGANLQSASTFTGLSAGTYYVMVKDAASCSDLGMYVITQPPAVSIYGASVPAKCYGGYSGQINVGSTGGTGLHLYSVNGINYQSGSNFQSLAAGTYTVYARDVAMCIGKTVLTVTQPSSINIVMSVSATPCNGESNGFISAVGTGGTGSFVYSLDGGTNYQPGGTFNNLAAGTYAVKVKDENNCVFSTNAVIGAPPAITTTVGTTNSTCGFANGGLLVMASGGAGNFQYSINGTTFNNTGSFSSLASGTYYILVKDGNNCVKIVVATINDSNGPVILNESHTNVSCSGGSNGSLAITNVTGGSGTLLYSINGVSWQTSPAFNNLAAGTYVVIVKDANGCAGTISIPITQPNPFVINPMVVNEKCHAGGTGAATITAAGGAGVLAYSLDNGLNLQSTNIFNGLKAGYYTVLVKDAANCVATQSFVITEPPAINVSTGVLNVRCNGESNGAITVGANGGTGQLLYSINGFSYTPSNVFTGLPGNFIYLVYVKDGNSCVKTQTVLVSQPAALNVNSSQNNVACSGGNNGAVNLAVNGGVYPYYYYWSNGSHNQGIYNLTAGTYSVLVADYNGCTSTRNFTVTQPANPLIINGSLSHATGANTGDGSIDVTVTGGSGPYTFKWSNGSENEDITQLAPGAYLLTVTDANGCMSSSTFIVGNITSLADNFLESSEVLVYPNPASEKVTVEVKNTRIDKVQMMNLVGQMVFESTPGATSERISTSGLARGCYFIKVFAGNQVVTKRVTVID